MKAMLIGAGQESLHTIQKAKEHGLTVIALDGNPEAAGLKVLEEEGNRQSESGGKGASCQTGINGQTDACCQKHKALAVDISREETVIQTALEEQPDFVLTAPIGRYLTTVGAVNDALGLPGISKEMAVLCTDKLKFHQRLNAQGLRNCRCYGLGEEKQGKSIEEAAGNRVLSYPAILKPRYGSGSRGIHFIQKEAELGEALAAIEEEPYVLEECVQGEEYGADGAVTGGEFHLVLLRRKENTPLPARQAVAYFSVLPEASFYREVKHYLEKVIECLGLSECLFHADLIEGAEGPFVIELSARPSGHNLHNLFTPLCTGVDMAEEYIKYRMGEPCCLEPKETRSMMIHYFDMEGRVLQVPGRDEIEKTIGRSFAAWKCSLQAGDVLLPVTDGHSLMGRGYFVLEGKSEEELQALAGKVKGMFMTPEN